MNKDLLPIAKRKLRIDEADVADDARIVEIIESSEAELRDALGLPSDFDLSVPGAERDLLLARVFYEWNDALDDFEVNYFRLMTTVREKWIAKAYAETEEDIAVV